MGLLGQIAVAVACDAAAVARVVPQLDAALAAVGVSDWLSKTGLYATVATETDFIFSRELADGWAYEGRADLGNTEPGDGPRYKGAGWIEITGRHNFGLAAAALGVDFLTHPEWAAAEPYASRIAAWYFVTHNMPALCHAADWVGVREAVNGGTNGWGRFYPAVRNLLKLTPAVPRPTRTLLGVAATLRLLPRADSHDVADLAAGVTLRFLAPAPTDPDGVTPHWVYVETLSGTTQKRRAAAGLKGWLLRAQLRTEFV